MNASYVTGIFPFLAAVNGLITSAGQPANLFFAIPPIVDITKKSYRGTRFYKDEKIFGVIHKRHETRKNCTKEGICLQLNTTCAKVEIPKTKISDGGSYSVEVLFTEVNSNFKSSQKLEVIKGK